jgi:hypothetical protein
MQTRLTDFSWPEFYFGVAYLTTGREVKWTMAHGPGARGRQ